MRLMIILTLILHSSISIATPIAKPDIISGVGEIVGHKQGLAYFKGLEGKVVSVQTQNTTVEVFVTQLGTTAPQVGETIYFSGTTATFADFIVVNTNEGYLYRLSGKTLLEQMQERMAEAQKEMALLSSKGIPNAVPIMTVESKAQKEEKRTKEEEERQTSNTNLLLSLISIFLAILALERVPTLAIPVINFIKRIFKSKKSNSEKN